MEFRDGDPCIGYGVLQHARESLANSEYSTTASSLSVYLGVATLVTDLRLELNRARYDMLIALIALERATAGGYCAGLDKAPLIVDSAGAGKSSNSSKSDKSDK